jgi:hypothetical protein
MTDDAIEAARRFLRRGLQMLRNELEVGTVQSTTEVVIHELKLGGAAANAVRLDWGEGEADDRRGSPIDDRAALNRIRTAIAKGVPLRVAVDSAARQIAPGASPERLETIKHRLRRKLKVFRT